MEQEKLDGSDESDDNESVVSDHASSEHEKKSNTEKSLEKGKPNLLNHQTNSMVTVKWETLVVENFGELSFDSPTEGFTLQNFVLLINNKKMLRCLSVHG